MIKNKKIKDIITFSLKPLAEGILNKRIRKNYKYFRYVKNKKIISDTFLLESYHAVSTTGNVYALFKKLYELNPQGKYYWVIKKESKNEMLVYLKGKNIEFVDYESDKYYKLLATCEYLINDTSFMPYFIKKRGQTYVNTWHGTPLKTLGKDIKNSSIHAHKNIQRNLLQTDVLLMPNEFTAEKLLESHDLSGVFKGKVYITGNARVDFNWSDPLEIRRKYNIPLDKKIILYAPTWKKTIDDTTQEDILELLDEVNRIQESVSSEYIVLLKAHYFVYDYFLALGFEDKIVPNWVDTNELLSIVDKLITDYSSIFFDYLPLNRPIYFLIPDRESYERMRGFYLDLDKLPGSVSINLSDMLDKLNIDIKRYLNEYNEKILYYLNEFCSCDDGRASDRGVDIILNNNSLKTESPSFSSNKKIILLYGGGLYNNGITSSLINLSKRIDYSNYELVIIESTYFPSGKQANMQKLDARARVVFQFSHSFKTLLGAYNQNMFYRQGLSSKFISTSNLRKDMEFEISRLIGNLKPDIVIDFGGYNKYFSTLFALGNFNKKIVYLHSLMIEEYNKVVNNKFVHKWNLKIIFSLYNLFDSIVSVSESSNEQNKKDLKLFGVNTDKMTYINNIIDHEKILISKNRYKEINEGKRIKSSIDGKMRVPYSEHINDFGIQTVSSMEMPDPSKINFICVGRLSPEKNHITLLRAFKIVHDNNIDVRLYIVGTGPLLSNIITEIHGLGLEKVVQLVGQLSNPAPLIELSDCLISSSNYEGQGLVLIEAMVLKKHVLGTNVVGNKSVLKKYPHSLVENSVSGLVHGMERYISGDLQINDFEAEKYNKESMNYFYQIIN